MRVSNIYQCLNIISPQQGRVQLFHLMFKIIDVVNYFMDAFITFFM